MADSHFKGRFDRAATPTDARRLMQALGNGSSSDLLTEGVVNKFFTDERAQDALAAAFAAGTMTGITITYDDVNNKFNITVSSPGWLIVKKAADEIRSSTTTLTNDSALSFACAAGSTYRVRVRVLFNQASTTMNFKFQMAYSAVFTEIVTERKQMQVASAIGSANFFTAASTGIINVAVTMTAAVIGYGAVEYDVIFTATAAGTFSFQWAQGTSVASNLTVLRGSYLEYQAF